MKTAVTGGSGVVGSVVVSHLVDAGHDVIALARSERSETKLAGLGATVSPGNVLDSDSLERLVQGCDWVFHVAGINELCSKDPGYMWQVNVEGTRLVMDASRQAGVTRLIHTSSAVTIGQNSGVVADEDTVHRGWFLSAYEESKTEAERVLFEESEGLGVVAVNPSSVQGPGRSTGTGRLLLDAARGKLPFVIDTSFSMVDIDDCARGHLLAAEAGKPGSRYLLSGTTLTMADALTVMAEVVGRDLSPATIPGWLVSPVAALVEWGARISGRKAPFCREMARVMKHDHRYDGSRATRELALSYTPIETTLRGVVDWFRREGLL